MKMKIELHKIPVRDVFEGYVNNQEDGVVGSAKKYFSRTNCIAYKIAGKYLNGSSIRQDYLETALKWITDREGCTIEEYMSLNHHNDDAAELINYFQDVIDWIEKIFIKYYKEMKGIEWGVLYNKYGSNPLDIASVTARVDELMADFDVTSKKGIYTYILSGEEKYLNIRKFDERTRKNVYAKQNGKCVGCGKEFKLSELEADHITAWSKGGKTIPENCQLLCKNCNLKKSDR
ncbi:MAG: HNH endonuclease [Selenomonadaceae bacterium]|nr:HNH endonuclease [Selenomonadaceae bacterium]